MKFEGSTHQRSWIFSIDVLNQKRLQAVLKRDQNVHTSSHKSCDSSPALSATPAALKAMQDQELLIRFHAHQIKSLFPTISDRVKATAVAYLRRFYVNNSVIQHHPRPIAVACLFLASKVEEQRIDIDDLSQATYNFYERVQNNTPCAMELPPVSRFAIEEAERKLMQGINFHLICHHPTDNIEPIVSDVTLFLAQELAVGEASFIDHVWEEFILDKTTRLAEHAMLHSDVVFHYSPVYIAFALAFLAIESEEMRAINLEELFRKYSSTRLSAKLGETAYFINQVNEIRSMLRENPLMFLGAPVASSNTRARELRRVLCQAATQRVNFNPINDRKHLIVETPEERSERSNKMIRVTPIGHEH